MDNWFEITQVQATLPRLAEEFDGYRLVHISDLHTGTWLNQARLDEAVSLVNQQRPNMIAITGDFVSHRPDHSRAYLADSLKSLQSGDGTVAVLGNHDHWVNPSIVRQTLQAAGIIELNNRVRTIERGNAKLHLAGIDDAMEEMDRIGEVIRRLPAQGAAILLAHEPDFAEVSVRSGRFDLQLSGHTHGGQIILPLIGPPYLPRMGRKYPSGLYQKNGMLIYTNRGLGTTALRLRWNAPAEITVITLRSPKIDSCVK